MPPSNYVQGFVHLGAQHLPFAHLVDVGDHHTLSSRPVHSRTCVRQYSATVMLPPPPTMSRWIRRACSGLPHHKPMYPSVPSICGPTKCKGSLVPNIVVCGVRRCCFVGRRCHVPCLLNRAKIPTIRNTLISTKIRSIRKSCCGFIICFE